MPVAEGEAVWIGVVRSAPAPALKAIGWHQGRTADLSDGRTCDLAGAKLLPETLLLVLAGLPGSPLGLLPFSLAGQGEAAGCRRIEIVAIDLDGAMISEPAGIELVAPAEFESRTGCKAPGPADPAGGYQGWRLP